MQEFCRHKVSDALKSRIDYELKLTDSNSAFLFGKLFGLMSANKKRIRDRAISKLVGSHASTVMLDDEEIKLLKL